MKFKEAFEKMKSGAKMKLPGWGGYWYWDSEKETIMMRCRQKNPLPDRPDCLEVNSKWSHVIACFKDSTVYYNIRDSLAAVVHRIPKRKFLWWSWGTKGYKLELVNFNHNTKID